MCACARVCLTHQGCNLYVKNLDESISDDWLRANFGKFGTITSARVMRDQTTGASKGFGFVCYSTPEEASAAIQKMNNKMFMGKPVYVALSQVQCATHTQFCACACVRMRVCLCVCPPRFPKSQAQPTNRWRT